MCLMWSHLAVSSGLSSAHKQLRDFWVDAWKGRGGSLATGTATAWPLHHAPESEPRVHVVIAVVVVVASMVGQVTILGHGRRQNGRSSALFAVALLGLERGPAPRTQSGISQLCVMICWQWRARRQCT